MSTGSLAILTTGTLAGPTPILRGADRECDVVDPLDLLLDHLELQVRTLTSKPVPREAMREAASERFLEEE